MIKIVRMLLIVSILTVFTACSQNKPGAKDNAATSPAPQESAKDGESPKPGGDPMMGNPIENAKKLREITPKLIKDIKKIMIDEMNKLWPSLNNTDKQILMLSPANKIGYLINNQKPELGSKEDVIEYSTDSIKDVQLLVRPFQLAPFNDLPTYVINLDMVSNMSQPGQSDDKAYEDLFKFVVHEGVHVLSQHDEKTAEAMGSRAEKYPEDTDSRYYRNEMFQYLKEATAAKNKDEKLERIQNATYFYELYLNGNEKNKQQDGYDNIEGMATYLQEKAYQLLTHPDASAKELNDLTAQSIIKNMSPADKEALLVNKGREFYDIGGLGIAIAVDMGLDDKSIFSTSPLSLLDSKFGSKKAEGHENIKKASNDFYATYNNRLKTSIDDVASKQTDDKYAAIRIPLPIKDAGGAFSEFIEYEYKGNKAEIQTVSREVSLGDTRIKLNNMKTIFIDNMMMAPSGKDAPNANEPSKSMTGQPDPNMIMGYTIVYVPKKDITIKDNLLTVQRDDLLIFDAKYELIDGEYQILNK